MAAVGPQSSRAGLITAAVIFAALFVVATVVAFNRGVEGQKAQEQLDNLKKKYADIINDTELTGSTVQESLGRQPGTAAKGARVTVVDALVKDRQTLAKLITGDPGSYGTAEKTVVERLATASSKVKPSSGALPQSDNVLAAVDTLVAEVVTVRAQLEDRDKKVAAAEESAKAAIKQKEELLGAKDQDVAKIRTDTQKEIADAGSAIASKQAQIKELEDAREAERKTSADALAKTQTQVSAQETQIKGLKRDVEKLTDRLYRLRGINVSNAAVRQADGYVVRNGGNGLLYINLGQGDQITTGMTFEVYDKIDGVPPAEAKKDDELPEGKGSVEVVSVGTSSSQCRIIKQKLGKTITEGDFVVNLVYDKNTKYNFVTYGKFDVDGNGIYSPADGEVIKRLVTQWGGKLQDQVNVDTDFVVLGKEPTILQLTTEEKNEPALVNKLQQSEKDYNDYMELRQKARDLHIPILNQNRFLYFVGYYDQAKR